jgi:hypothetical protein
MALTPVQLAHSAIYKTLYSVQQCNGSYIKKSQHYKKNLLLWKKNEEPKKKIVKLPRVRSIPNDHVTT